MSSPEPPEQPESSVRVIRRYANRKLYDTSTGRFTSLREVDRLVREGIDVQVLDRDTGADLTQRVLGRIVAADDSSDLPFATLLRMPRRVARALVVPEDDEGRAAELLAVRQSLTELTGVVDQLLAQMGDEDSDGRSAPLAES